MGRPDGTLLTNLSMFRKLNPILMRTRTESTIFIPTQIDVTETLKYIEQWNAKKERKITLFTILLTGIVRTFAFRPQLNRFVIGNDLYQRNEISFSFIAKKELSDHGEEANVKMRFSPFETIDTIAEKMFQELNVARSKEGNESDREVKELGKYPFWIVKRATNWFRFLNNHNMAPKSMIRTDPLFVSGYIANVGSIKMPAPFHHLFEWGTASLFFGIGEYYKTPKVNEKNEIIIRDVVDVIVTYDDRVSEGIYGAKAIKFMKNFVENPKTLEVVPEIPPEILTELKLKEFPAPEVESDDKSGKKKDKDKKKK